MKQYVCTRPGCRGGIKAAADCPPEMLSCIVCSSDLTPAEVECDECAGTGRYGFRDDDVCRFCNGTGWRASPHDSPGVAKR